MRWESKLPAKSARRSTLRFAFWPMFFDGTWVWLERYEVWWRYDGEAWVVTSYALL